MEQQQEQGENGPDWVRLHVSVIQVPVPAARLVAQAQAQTVVGGTWRAAGQVGLGPD